ncbi:hypothetical protein FQN54_000595 [Arachnomyces sp. PD_36]|nr:hypothetical protein FQN54_000595 [Arachnomyces sp. PD_36]
MSLPAKSPLRLTPTQLSAIPSHSDLPNSNPDSNPPLYPFLLSALTEANTFISETVPQTFTVDPKLRSSPPSKAKVELSTATIRREGALQDDGEYWVSRRSVHDDDAEGKGSASFEDFVRGLRDDHTENEMAYTPSVSGVEKVLEWDCDDEQVGGGWRDVKMAATLITHTFNPSFLISPRKFFVLVITASLPPTTITVPPQHQQPSGFLTLQIPLSPNDLPKAKSRDPKKGIFATYASVERVTLLPSNDPNDPENSSARRRIEWRTATTSDAGGWIPKRVQRSWSLGGVPRAVVHDVGLFMGWVERERERGKGKKGGEESTRSWC